MRRRREEEDDEDEDEEKETNREEGEVEETGATEKMLQPLQHQARGGHAGRPCNVADLRTVTRASAWCWRWRG
jgi:hypothetical protein